MPQHIQKQLNYKMRNIISNANDNATSKHRNFALRIERWKTQRKS